MVINSTDPEEIRSLLYALKLHHTATHDIDGVTYKITKLPGHLLYEKSGVSCCQFTIPFSQNINSYKNVIYSEVQSTTPPSN